jgi:hypothetical protein
MFLRNSLLSIIFLIIILLIISVHCNLKAQPNNTTLQKSDPNIIDTLKKELANNSFFSKILKAITVNDDELKIKNSIVQSDTAIIKKYSGKIIRNINVNILDVFGGSVFNPEDSTRSWLQNTGNSLHIKTKEWVIKDKIILLKGERLFPDDIKESERILRQSPYVYDVRIIPQDIGNNNDSTDIMVYIQDIWSTNGSIAYRPSSKSGGFSLTDLNFLGLGNDFKGGLKFDPQLENGWDWNASYTYDNIEKTYLSANISYLSEVDHQQYGIMIGRDFFSPIIKWAGALAQNWQNYRFPGSKNSVGEIERAKFNQQDYWLGYAFDFRPYDSTTLYQNRFNIAGRITRTTYSQRPEFDTLNYFKNNVFYLGRIGFSYIKYYQDSYIFGLGKTEDIPIINMIELLFGIEKGISTNRPYYGIKTGYSFRDNNLGYFYGGIQVGAFRSEEKWLNRNSIWDMFFFSNLKSMGSYKWRYYIGSRYSYTYDPLLQIDNLNINKDAGLRGFSVGDLIGNKKLVLNYEADIFLPLKILGFNTALITFADFGLISTSYEPLIDSKLYQGYGFGFRIQNEHLIFPSIQIMFGYYPNTFESGGTHFNIFNQSSLYYKFNQSQFSIPSIVTAQ